MLPATLIAQLRTDFKKQALKEKLPSSLDTNRVNALLGICSKLLDTGIIRTSDALHAKPYCKEALTLSLKLKFQKGEALSYLYFSKIYLDDYDRNKGIQYARKAQFFFKKLNADLYIADTYVLLTMYDQYLTPHIHEAQKYCDSAIAILKKRAPRSLRMARALVLEGVINEMVNNQLTSFKNFQQSLAIYQLNKYPYLQNIYAQISSSYSHTSNYNLAIEYAYKSLKLAEKYRDTSRIFSVCTALSLYYEQTNQPFKNLIYLERARHLVNYHNSSNQATFLAGRLVAAYAATSQFKKAIAMLQEGFSKGDKQDEVYKMLYIYGAEAYLMMKDYRRAEKYYPMMMDAIKDIAISTFPAVRSHFIAIRLFLATHQFDKARRQLVIMEPLRNLTPFAADVVTLERLEFQVDSAEGNLTGAIKHYQEYKRLSDSLNIRSHNDQIAQTEVLYQLDKVNEDLALKQRNIQLLTKQSKLQTQMLHTESKARYYLYAGLLLAILIVTLLINRTRLQRKSNQTLSLQQEEIRSQNETLSGLLTEREWLLKEVHHRVKNNLQIVISLLNSQLSFIEDDKIREVIRSSQRRMYSIALIHQRIYQTENLSGIDIKDYIESLTAYLADTFDLAGKVKVIQNIESVRLEVSQGVSLGLIINEAVTNSIKYAFWNKEKPAEIKIDLKISAPRQLELIIADNGVGLPENFDIDAGNSLGISLIKGLTRQLKGKVQFLTDQGVVIKILITEARLLPG